MSSHKELEKIKSGSVFARRNGQELTKNGKQRYNFMRSIQDFSTPMLAVPTVMTGFSLGTGSLSIAAISAAGALASYIAVNATPLAYRKDSLLILARTFQAKTAFGHLESTPWIEQKIDGKKLKTNKHYLEYANENERGIVEVIVHRKKFRDMIISMTKYPSGGNTNPLLENLGSWDEALKLAK